MQIVFLNPLTQNYLMEFLIYELLRQKQYLYFYEYCYKIEKNYVSLNLRKIKYPRNREKYSNSRKQ